MRTKVTYLLFSTLFLGQWIPLTRSQHAHIDEGLTETISMEEEIEANHFDRIVYGKLDLFGAVVYHPAAPAEEVEVVEETPPPVEEEQETVIVQEETPDETVPPQEPEKTEATVEKESSGEAADTSQPEPEVTEDSSVNEQTEEETYTEVPEKSSEEIVEEPSEEAPEDTVEEPSEEPVQPDTSTVDTASEQAVEPAEEKEEAAPEPEVDPYEEELYVLNQVISQLPFDAEGHQFFLLKLDDAVYQVEIRQSNPQGDEEISNMTGIYQYNLDTGHLSAMDPITGEFE